MKPSLKTPFFVLLLPVFFVLHGFMENYNFVPVKDALFLTGVYMASSVMFLLLAWLLLRNLAKAAMVAVYIMAFHFFFGSMHDLLKRIAPGAFFTKYVFVLGAAFALLVLMIITLKRRKQPVTKMVYYLNVLFLLLIAIDVVFLIGKITAFAKEKPSLPEGMAVCQDCARPDIYLILADEYIGNTSLKEQFNFDNTAFIQELANRGFHTIPHSSSNYNFTPHSMASTLDMDYLDLKAKIKRDQPDLALCYQTIQNNKLLRFLQHNGYDFYNYSIFDFKGQPARTLSSFLPLKTKLITGQTFLTRVDRDIRFNLVTRFKSESELKRITYDVLKRNNKIYDQTLEMASKTETQPRFIFTHLHLPHYPYFFDSNGNERPFEKLVEGNQDDKELYVEYLQYGNKKYLALIDEILKRSKQPPVIILMGDHGFRHFQTEVDPKYFYQNLVSLRLPGNNYAGFTDSLTNVNFFRVFLNNQFRQQLPMLKDSTIFIHE
jgi:hypothetical protein